jgi:glutathionylspermidine synthase
MKLNISVEVDWISEDGNIDDEVKNEIIQGVKKAISESCMVDMEKQSKEAFNSAVASAASKIDARALEFAEEWLENEVTITDKWGDAKDTLTVKDLIKKSFDNLLERSVNGRGEFSNSYDGKHKLIEYLTGARVEDEVTERMKDFRKDIDKRIDDAIKNSIKDNVSDRFAQMVIGAAKQDYHEQQALIANSAE